MATHNGDRTAQVAFAMQQKEVIVPSIITDGLKRKWSANAL